MARTESLSTEYQKLFGKKIRRKALGAVTKTVLLGGALAGAQALHVHPEVAQHIPQFIDSGAELLRNASDTIGGFLNSAPIVGDAIRYVPNLVQTQTPVGGLLNEAGLTIVEAGAVAAGMGAIKKSGEYAHDRKKAEIDEKNIRTADAMTEAGQMGVPLLSRSEGGTIFGNAKKVAMDVLKKPKDKWNEKRIREALRFTLTETLQAKKTSFKDLMNPRVAGQLGGEVAEQTAKIFALHLSKLAFASTGFIFWGAQHYGFTKREAKKIGAPELIKASWLQFPGGFLPIVGGIAFAVASVPMELWLKGHLKRIYKYTIAGLDRDLQKSGSATSKEAQRIVQLQQLVKESLEDPTVLSEAKQLPATYNGLLDIFRQSKDVRQRDDAVEKVETLRRDNMAELVRREGKGALSRHHNRKRIRALYNIVSAEGTQLVNLKTKLFDTGDVEAQLAGHLKNIYAPYVNQEVPQQN